METIQAIKANEVYKQIIKDAMGGVMYNVANRHKYDTSEIMALWLSMSPGERSSADGIITGAFAFLAEED
jgi:hypothetical protein